MRPHHGETDSGVSDPTRRPSLRVPLSQGERPQINAVHSPPKRVKPIEWPSRRQSRSRRSALRTPIVRNAGIALDQPSDDFFADNSDTEPTLSCHLSELRKPFADRAGHNPTNFHELCDTVSRSTTIPLSILNFFTGRSQINDFQSH